MWNFSLQEQDSFVRWVRTSFSVASAWHSPTWWCFGKGTQSPAIALLWRNLSEGFHVSNLDPDLERGNAQEVGVGTGHTQLARDGRCLSMSLGFSACWKDPPQSWGAQRNTNLLSNKKYSSEGGQIKMLKSFNGSLTRMRWEDPLNLSILISGGKETNKDSLSNGEWKGKSSRLNRMLLTDISSCNLKNVCSTTWTRA